MIDEVTVRSGGVDDLFPLISLMERAFPAEFGEAWNMAQCRSMLSMSGTTLLLCMHGEKLCGFAMARVILDEAELLLFAVDPELRNRGLGQKMLQAFEDRAKQLGVKTLFLEVRSGNSAQHLYSKFGFVQIGQRIGYYKGDSGSLYDAITYKKIC